MNRTIAVILVFVIAAVLGIALFIGLNPAPRNDFVEEPNLDLGEPDVIPPPVEEPDVIPPPVEEPDVIPPPVEGEPLVESPIVTPIVHASVMVEFAGTVIHIDPHQSIDYSSYEKADVILITHHHQDHFNENKIRELLGPSTRVFGPSGVDDASREITIEVLSYGDVLEIDNLEIEVIPAYNVQKQFHPPGLNNGYLLTIDQTRIFIGGDTECTPEMSVLGDIDVALLPIDGQFTMSPREAAECFESMGPRQAIPYHQNQSDPEEVRDLLSDVVGVEVLILRLP